MDLPYRDRLKLGAAEWPVERIKSPWPGQAVRAFSAHAVHHGDEVKSGP